MFSTRSRNVRDDPGSRAMAVSQVRTIPSAQASHGHARRERRAGPDRPQHLADEPAADHGHRQHARKLEHTLQEGPGRRAHEGHRPRPRGGPLGSVVGRSRSRPEARPDVGWSGVARGRSSLAWLGHGHNSSPAALGKVARLLLVMSHPALGLPPADATAGRPDVAARLRSAARLPATALEAAFRIDETLPQRYDDLMQRTFLRDYEQHIEQLARAIETGEQHFVVVWGESLVPIYRRRNVRMNDVVSLLRGLEEAALAAWACG